jgi:chromosome segregation ATPase
MTRRQANLISYMIRSQTISSFHDARKELLASCEEQKSDAAAPQPSVTVTATSSQSEPVPPSTPKPLDSGWWKVRQAEALQEQIVIIADQRETIVELKKRIEYGDKHNNELVAANAEIHESLRHWGLEQTEPCSLVNNVKQVIQLCAERGKRGTEQEDKIKSLTDQIEAQSKAIAALTEERDQLALLAAKRAGELNRYSDGIAFMDKQREKKDKDINGLKDVITSQDGKIASLTEQRDHWDKLAAQRAGKMNQYSDMIDLMEKQADQKDKKIDDLQKVIDVMAKQQPSDDRDHLRAVIAKLQSEKTLLCEWYNRKISEIKSLKEVITSQDGKIASLKESVDNRTKMIESLKKEIEALKKDLAEANTDNGLLIKKGNVIKELKDICDNRQGFIDKSIDIIDNLRKQLGDKSSKIDILKKEIEILGKQIENMKKFSRDDRDILYRKDFEIHALKTQVAVLVKNQQTITP